MKRLLKLCAIMVFGLGQGSAIRAQGLEIYSPLSTLAGTFRDLCHSSRTANPLLLLATLPQGSPTGGEEPNFYVRMSAGFMGAIGEQDIQPEDDWKFSDCILGTSIFGATHTRDQHRTTTLLPSNDGAILYMKLTGKAYSETVGYHSPVTLRSHGVTNFTGYKQIMLDQYGMHSGAACATACTSTTIDSICVCGGRLVQRIATRKVYQSKPEGEAIAGEHAAARVRKKVDELTAENLVEQNNSFHEKIIDPLMKWNAYPALRFSSTPDNVWIVGRESNGDGTAAPTAPPVELAPAMLAVQVHESFINNMTAKTLGGRTLSDEEVSKSYKDFFNSDLNETLNEAEKEQGGAAKPAEQAPDQKTLRNVTFTKTRPVQVTFGNQEFEIMVRAERYARPELNLPDLPGMEVTAHYKIHRGAGGDYAERTKFLVEVSPEAQAIWDKKLKSKELTNLEWTATKGASRRAVERYFQRRFPERIVFKGLEFTKAPLAKVTADGKMTASQLDTDRGWLTVGWDKHAAATKQ